MFCVWLAFAVKHRLLDISGLITGFEGRTNEGREKALRQWKNQQKCHFFVSRIRTKPPIIMCFGALILYTLIKSFSFELERLHENCLHDSILKVET